MTTLREVQQILADTIESAIDGLSAYPGAVDSINPPAVMITPHNPFVDYTRNMRMKSARWILKATIVVAWNDELNSQYDLNEFLDVTGDRSIPRAIYNARHDLPFVAFCDQGTDYGARYTIAGTECLGAVLRIQVEAEGE